MNQKRKYCICFNVYHIAWIVTNIKLVAWMFSRWVFFLLISLDWFDWLWQYDKIRNIFCGSSLSKTHGTSRKTNATYLSLEQIKVQVYEIIKMDGIIPSFLQMHAFSMVETLMLLRNKQPHLGTQAKYKMKLRVALVVRNFFHCFCWIRDDSGTKRCLAWI